jgi:non-ribosomal peptide synthetase component E (peptide arylation enzyme)
MVRPTRYTQEMFDELFNEGMWTEDTTGSLWVKNASKYPEKNAFVESKRRFSWEKIRDMSDVLALNLLDLEIDKDEFVFVLLPNWVESYITRCACEKVGILCGTALMTLREKEIEYILKTFDAVGVVIPVKFKNFDYLQAIEKMKPNLPSLRHIFVVDEDTPAGTISLREKMEGPRDLQTAETVFQDRGYKPTDVSVIGFTSGTTGMPKGAEHVIAARMAMARGYGEPAGVKENDIVLNIISPVAGLSSAFCYNGTVNLVGATVVLSDIWSPEETLKLIKREKVTILLAVPAQLSQIVNSPHISNCDLGSLRCIYTSTAPITYELATQVEEVLGVPCINLYGQIDGGFISAPSIDDHPEIRRATLGKPHRFTQIWILDNDGNPVGPGEKGELVYTGPSTCGGYYRNMDATLEVWGVLGEGGKCRSGDTVQLDEEGHLILAGRKKDMIIRGGQNIYPAEIEGLLLAHPKIQAVAVVPMPDPVMGEKACAYVQLSPGAHMAFEEMIDFLKKEKFARYKLPERLEIREKLPLRGEQKIAKASLCDDIARLLKEESKQ